MKKIITIIVLAISMCSYAQFESDASHEDLDFWKFKVRLESYVKEKDTQGLKSLLAENVYESTYSCAYPGCSKEDFMNYYFKEDAEDSWRTMAMILRFGFNRLKTDNLSIAAPSDQTMFKGPAYMKDIDTNKELIVLGENVNIRSRPSLNSKVIGKASFQKFECDCDPETMSDDSYQTVGGIAWIKILLEDGATGYVASRYTSFEVTREMTIAKVNGNWKIISFFQEPECQISNVEI